MQQTTTKQQQCSVHDYDRYIDYYILLCVSTSLLLRHFTQKNPRRSYTSSASILSLLVHNMLADNHLPNFFGQLTHRYYKNRPLLYMYEIHNSPYIVNASEFPAIQSTAMKTTTTIYV